ncbi:MAG TPA: nicotinate-nucleotide adenylyltransferase [Actinomycetota bacterium]|nr:nicotinate-nucleotide adenylyltransferase [Actinomycetota bacterium]
MANDQAGSVARLGVIGGTFDPIHVGHLVAASEALNAFSLDRVMFVPAGRPWQKSTHADPEDRFMMTTLAAAHHTRFSVSRIELDRKGPTYTVDTLATLKDFFNAQTFFIAGADTVAELDTWHDVERLSELTEMIAVTRPGYSLDTNAKAPGWPKIHAMEIPGLDVSSTMIRARVAAGKPIDYLVPTDVARYISRLGLYVGGTHG